MYVMYDVAYGSSSTMVPGDWIVAEDGLINKHNRNFVR